MTDSKTRQIVESLVTMGPQKALEVLVTLPEEEARKYLLDMSENHPEAYAVLAEKIRQAHTK